MAMSRYDLSRRGLLGLGFAARGSLWRPPSARAETPLPLTPACRDSDEPTPAQTEGPYFTPNSPERSDLAVDVDGSLTFLTGYVRDRACRPIAGALLDLWHCDAEGRYDNQGYRLRGHQFTDEKGLFGFRTIMPGLYPGRTRHFHVKVQAPGGDVLTTQFYFPGEPGNAHDRIFDEALLLHIGFPFAGPAASYEFVLDRA
jgi:protocatechuate 3,4-dioxygenase beta subunit